MKNITPHLQSISQKYCINVYFIEKIIHYLNGEIFLLIQFLIQTMQIFFAPFSLLISLGYGQNENYFLLLIGTFLKETLNSEQLLKRTQLLGNEIKVTVCVFKKSISPKLKKSKKEKSAMFTKRARVLQIKDE